MMTAQPVRAPSDTRLSRIEARLDSLDRTVRDVQASLSRRGLEDFVDQMASRIDRALTNFVLCSFLMWGIWFGLGLILLRKK